MEMITVVHTGGPFLDQCWQGWEFLQSFNWRWIMPESVNDGLGFNQEEEEEEECFSFDFYAAVRASIRASPTICRPLHCRGWINIHSTGYFEANGTRKELETLGLDDFC
ncbi:hypothetical protein AAG906_012370 [Vitis piasezkii]